MSRVGAKSVSLPEGVKVRVESDRLVVEAGQAQLAAPLRPEVSVEVDEEAREARVSRRGDTRAHRAMHGTTRALLANMVRGVTEGYTRELEITGVGWTAAVDNGRVALNVGYADTKYVPIPQNLDVQVQQARITVRGADKQAVGQLAARIRGVRPPEPYNGKGIKYAEERIVRKEGKAFASK
jgi:large subunit ribosomal protein L6